MANENELDKASLKKDPDEKSPKKADAKAKASKSKSGKPKKGIIKYFKDAKSEFKKVVWPTPKSTTNNTIVVIVVCLVAALFIFGVDSLFGFLNGLILRGNG